ncbi:hypothetical protein KIT90_13085 [Vibrio sp. B172a]|uniref:hypothetical protein n=1 Tax=Vibrio sp. B172a TaxID=2835790 RepID=UPI0025569A54|nr:hypothetical protein [Vibrio sp. B172a]MDK9782316.1 hypothetical protein [Vibrio sp. B172a]
MKKTLLALTAAATMALPQISSAAEIGTAVFQWTGTVPAATDNASGYWIVTGDGSALLSANDGVMVFDNTKGKVTLSSASTFGFKVVSDVTSSSVATADGTFDPSVDNTGVAYHGKLVRLAAGANGLTDVGGDGGYFGVTVDDTLLPATGKFNAAANVVSQVSIGAATAGADFEKAEALQKWNVQASIALSTTAI